MKKNNDGFIAMSVIYSIFIVFIMIMITIMFSYVSSRRNSNRIKNDIRNQFSNLGPNISFSKNGSEDNHINYRVAVEVTKSKYSLNSVAYRWSKTIESSGAYTTIPVGADNADEKSFVTISPEVEDNETNEDYYLIVKACDVQLNCTIAVTKRFRVSSEEVPVAQLETGEFVNQKMKALSGQAGEYVNTAITGFDRYIAGVPSEVNRRENNRVSTNDSEYPIYMWYVPSTGKIMYYTEADLVELNPNSADLFLGLSKMTSVNLSSFRTDNVTNFSHFFYLNAEITELDLSKFNTSSATDMSYMFSNMYKIENIDIRSFNTNHVTDMNHMFDSCTLLNNWQRTSSTFTTARVTDMSYMFFNCDNITVLNLVGFDTRKVTDMSSMFETMDSLTTIKVGNYFGTDLVTDSKNMFMDDFNLVGGRGTTYSSGHKDKEYARVDESHSRGYFTSGV